MEGKAYAFFHPQYGGLRVINTDEGLFFCIKDLVAITDISRDKLFPVLADTEGRVEEFYVAEITKNAQNGYKGRVFFGEAFGDAEKELQSHRKVERTMIFVDSQVMRDMTIGCSNNPERKLFYKWIKSFILPIMGDKSSSWCYACFLVEDAFCLPLEKPMDIRYTADGLYINGMRIN